MSSLVQTVQPSANRPEENGGNPRISEGPDGSPGLPHLTRASNGESARGEDSRARAQETSPIIQTFQEREKSTESPAGRFPDGRTVVQKPRARRVSTESSWAIHEGELNAGVDGCRWYVLQVEAGRECAAAREVRKRGYGTYVPCEVTRVCYPVGGVGIFRRSLFIGYCFVRFAPHRLAWHPIEEAFWVVRLVRIGDEPLPMPDGALEQVKAEADRRAAEALGPIGRRRRKSRFDPGQRLRVTEGPLYGLEGLFLVGDADRVTLLLDMLGGRPVQDIPDAIVEPV